jgi:hypothetical protein
MGSYCSVSEISICLEHLYKRNFGIWCLRSQNGQSFSQSGIEFNLTPYDVAPGSVSGVKGTIDVNQFNHAQAVAAEVNRVTNQFGDAVTIHPLASSNVTNEPFADLENINGNARYAEPVIGRAFARPVGSQ